CDRQRAVMERVREIAPPSVAFRDTDMTENQEAAAFYRAREHPTTVLEKDGHEVERWVGVVPAEKLLAALREHAEVQPGRPTAVPGVPVGGMGRRGVPAPGPLTEPPTPALPEEPPSPPR
ncbi:MAG TPA: thioredoxin family protein, partial [Candidatus Thermoplasmatota archaeon]|nr:thioredoxin family protein [Candidatus Thermoplasmatota archaeon]